MCGSLRYNDMVLPVKSGVQVPRILTIKQNGEPLSIDVPLSDWIFMREEKIESHWKKLVEEYVGLRFERFWEKNQWFNVPKGKTMVIGVYYDPRVDKYVGGIVTQPSAGKLVQLHTRMPYFASKWWVEEPKHWTECDKLMGSMSGLIHAPSNLSLRNRTRIGITA